MYHEGDKSGLLTYKEDMGIIGGRRTCSVQCNCGKVYPIRADRFKINKKGCGNCPNPYTINVNTVTIEVSTEKFPNTYMKIDLDDFLLYCKDTTVTPASTKGKRSTTIYGKVGSYYVHRLVMGSPEGLQIDHINGDGLDNRKSNLRVVTNKENGKNTGISRNNTSGYIGVSWDKRSSKWEANIKVDYKKISLGLYVNIEDAVLARKEAEVLYGFHENHGRS